ncbi:MAG: hypothetical protein ACI4II_04410 [Acutalibacteraceae bacterium]
MRACRNPNRTATAFAAGIILACFFPNRFVLVVLALTVIALAKSCVRC